MVKIVKPCNKTHVLSIRRHFFAYVFFNLVIKLPFYVTISNYYNVYGVLELWMVVFFMGASFQPRHISKH